MSTAEVRLPLKCLSKKVNYGTKFPTQHGVLLEKLQHGSKVWPFISIQTISVVHLENDHTCDFSPALTVVPKGL